MNRFLIKLNSVPGVIGSMICNDHGHLLANLFPPNIDQNSLNTLASLLSDNVPVFQECTGGVKNFNFKFENGRIIIRQGNDFYFLIYCSSSIAVNFQIIDMMLDVAAKQLEKSSTHKVEQTIVSPVIQAPKVTPADLIKNSPLSYSLNGMQSALIKFLGPMAIIVFSECVEKWLETEQPTKETLPKLISIIKKEIDDSNKSAQFMQMIDPYI